MYCGARRGKNCVTRGASDECWSDSGTVSARRLSTTASGTWCTLSRLKHHTNHGTSSCATVRLGTTTSTTNDAFCTHSSTKRTVHAWRCWMILSTRRQVPWSIREPSSRTWRRPEMRDRTETHCTFWRRGPLARGAGDKLGNASLPGDVRSDRCSFQDDRPHEHGRPQDTRKGVEDCVLYFQSGRWIGWCGEGNTKVFCCGQGLGQRKQHSNKDKPQQVRLHPAWAHSVSPVLGKGGHQNI